MPELEVHQVGEQDIYKDIVRISEAYRITKSGKRIKEGQVCHILTNGHSCLAVLRGTQQEVPHILMDDYTRRKLDVDLKQSYPFDFRRAGILGQLRWAWDATEIGYQVSARLAILGFLAGVAAILPEIYRMLSGLINVNTTAAKAAQDFIQVTVKRGTPPSMAFFAFVFAAIFALFNSVFTDLMGCGGSRYAWAGIFGVRFLARAVLFIVLFLFIMKSAWIHNWLSWLLDWLATEKYSPIT
jgi:hypothetical protein